ncbi:Os05g0480300, partial [Oryza sativa Japonica Group]
GACGGGVSARHRRLHAGRRRRQWPGQAVAASTPSNRPRAASRSQGRCKLMASRPGAADGRRCTLRQAAPTWQ